MDQNDGAAVATQTDERVTPATSETAKKLSLLTLADLVTSGDDLIDIPIRPKGRRAGDDRVAVLRFRGLAREELRHWKLLQYGSARQKPKPREARRLLCEKAVALLGVDLTEALAPYEGSLAKWLELDETGGLLAESTLDVYVSRCLARVEADDSTEE